jgi:hypothetical protein
MLVKQMCLIMFVIWFAQIEQVAAAQQPSAVSVLNKLEVKGRAPKTGYSRAQFLHWSDPDRNGCDARNDTLKRDLKNAGFKSDTNECKVISGELIDPFSGKILSFNLTTSASNIDIDHVVSLSNAWQTGAAYFSKEIRSNLANDPLNLLAVDAKLNRQKGDGDAATWLPPLKSYRCEYVSRQVAVKFKYSLWVTAPEKSAMMNILQKCSNQRIPKG